MSSSAGLLTPVSPGLEPSLEVYETLGIDFADAYLIASAEAAGVHDIISFDRSIDRATSVHRIEP